MGCLLIDDGYTFSGEIPTDRGKPAVKFRYRPALAAAVYEYYQPKSSGALQFKATTKLLMDHIVSWDIAGPDGQTVPKTEATLAKLPFATLEGLAAVVVSYSGEEDVADRKN